MVPRSARMSAPRTMSMPVDPGNAALRRRPMLPSDPVMTIRKATSPRGRAVSRRVDAAEAVHERGRRAGEENVEIAQPLELAVDRNPRQRRHVVEVIREKDAGTRGYCGRETDCGSQRELARRGRGGSADRIGEVGRL